MYTFLDAKIMARSLRTALAERHIDLSHSDSLELVARQFGYDNWNILASRIEAAREAPLPHGWYPHQEGQHIYRMAAAAADPLLLTLQSDPQFRVRNADIATLMQSRKAAPWRGARLAFSAELSGEEVDVASVWMRVDDSQGAVLAFDNLFETSGTGLSGTFDWTPISVELPIADAAASIGYGVILKGRGRLLARSPRLSPVRGEAVVA